MHSFDKAEELEEGEKGRKKTGSAFKGILFEVGIGFESLSRKLLFAYSDRVVRSLQIS